MFVIKGLYNGSICYYVHSKKDEELGFIVRTFTASIETATKYSSEDLAYKDCDELDEKFFGVFPVCPICGRAYSGYPAISRKDNETKICSDCGMLEALVDFDRHRHKNIAGD